MKLLIVNGDSHTAGNEIEYINQPTCYEKAWPKILSDKLNATHINLATPGASNQFIFRTTQDWVINNIIVNKTYKPKDIHIMIMWSGFDRHEVYFDDTNTIDNVNPLSIPEFYNTKMTRQLKNLQKTLVDFRDNLYIDFKALSIVYNMTCWLDSLGIKHSFINGLYQFPEINYLKSEYGTHAYHTSYLNLLLAYGDEKISKHMAFSDNNETFYTHMKDFSGIPSASHSQFSHWGEDGHKYWAQRVYDFFFSDYKIVIKKVI